MSDFEVRADIFKSLAVEGIVSWDNVMDELGKNGYENFLIFCAKNPQFNDYRTKHGAALPLIEEFLRGY